MDFELLLEAERRGILPADKAELLAEARKRGLVPGGEAAKPEAPKEQTWGEWAYGNLVGDPNDGVQNAGESIGTWLNRAGESATLGLVGDEASAAAYSALPGRTYEGELDRFRQNEANMSTGGRLSADLVGAVLPAATGIGLASKAATIPATMARGAVIGGAQGGTLGFMEGEGGLQNRAANAALGGGVGAALGGTVAPLVGAGVQKVADHRAANRAIAEAAANAPTTEQLRATGRAAYQAIDDAGVQIRPDRVQAAMGNIADGLRAEGAGYTGAEKVMPASRAIMEATGDVGAQSNTVPFKELDMFRRYMGTAARANPANQGDTRAATEALGQLDDFIAKLSPDDVDAGDVKVLQEMLPKARDTWARMSRSQTIDDAIEASQDYLSGGASGIRNQFARILRSPALSRGFTDAEKAVMRRAINGSIGQQTLNLLGGGMGQLMQMGAGFGMGGIPGAMAGAAAGAGFRKASENVAMKNAEVVRALIANGGMQALPVASDGARKVAEALTRRSGSVGYQ